MQTERNRYWFPKCKQDREIIVDQSEGRIFSIDPTLIASVSELLTLMLYMSGHNYQEISSIVGRSKSCVVNEMYRLRQANQTYNADLYSRASTLGLLNIIALTGLAAKVSDPEHKANLFRQIDNAATHLSKPEQTPSTEQPEIAPPIFKPRPIEVTLIAVPLEQT